MEHRQNDFHGGFALFGVNVHRDAAPVVRNGCGTVLVDSDINAVAVASHGFVGRIVHDLFQKVMQTARAGVADIHGGALSDAFQAFQDLNVLRLVIRWGERFFGLCDGRHFLSHPKSLLEAAGVNEQCPMDDGWQSAAE